MAKTRTRFTIIDMPVTKEQEKLVPFMLSDFQKLYYKKLENGNYKIYCSHCMKFHEINKSQFKYARTEHKCPICHKSFRCTSTKYITDFTGYIRIGKYGYRANIDFDLDNGPTLKDMKQMAYFANNCLYMKETKAYGMWWSTRLYYDPTKTEYRQSFSKYAAYQFIDFYHEYFYNAHLFSGSVLKEFYKEKFSYITKSNQIKLIIDNQFSFAEIDAIKLFDLKTKEEIEKYKEYIHKNQSDIFNLVNKKEFNIYHLDYLSRNNIDLGMYAEYCNLAKALGYKPDKPKDFYKRKDTLESIRARELAIKEAEKLKGFEPLVIQRYSELPRYENESITITPFANVTEIIACGKKLHNCIGTYVERYGNKNTDIYHLDLDGALKIAIEIRNGTLQQARADHNSKCPDELMKHIKLFCTKNNIKIGSYI